jgi:hypothetical protein
VIVVATTERNSRPIPWYLESYGAELRDTLVSVHYEELLDDPDPIDATYCFADIELLNDDELERAVKVREQLGARGCTVLNDPETTLRRVDLLHELQRAGTNDFGVYRVGEPLDACRYPVFVRAEHDHAGRRSELLDTRQEVDDALDALRAAAPELDDLLVVEFCDTADEHGIYRKYSAFAVGDAIIARHLFFSRHWHVKHADLRDDDLMAEEREFVETNPHRDVLRGIFELAGVQYGRIDYAFRDGQIRVWEINTNPMILIPANKKGAPPNRGRVHQTLRSAARTVATPVLSRSQRARSARERHLGALAERQPRAAVNHLFAERLAVAWAAIDRPAIDRPATG